MIAGTMPDMPTASPQNTHNGHPMTPGALRPSPPTSRDTIPPAPTSPADPAPEPHLEAKRPRSKRKTEIFLVIAAWLASTTFAVEGAWVFFGDTLHLPTPPRIAAFALFEISAVACAVMARRRRIDDVDSRFGGAPGGAVWVFAAVSGLLSASHEPTAPGWAARMIAPVMAAFLLDLLISGEQGDARERKGKRRKRINFKFSPERILIWAGLADASDRSAEEAARDKAIAQVASLCHRAQAPAAGWWFPTRRKTRAGRAYRKALEAANERYGLATNPKLMHQLITSVNLLDGAMDMTSGDAPVGVNPWTTTAAAAATARRTVSAASGTSTRANVSAAAKPDQADRRTTADRWEEYQALKAADPDITEVAAAKQMGISVTRLNNIKRAVRDGGGTP